MIGFKARLEAEDARPGYVYRVEAHSALPLGLAQGAWAAMGWHPRHPEDEDTDLVPGVDTQPLPWGFHTPLGWRFGCPHLHIMMSLWFSRVALYRGVSDGVIRIVEIRADATLNDGGQCVFNPSTITDARELTLPEIFGDWQPEPVDDTPRLDSRDWWAQAGW